MHIQTFKSLSCIYVCSLSDDKEVENYSLQL